MLVGELISELKIKVDLPALRGETSKTVSFINEALRKGVSPVKLSYDQNQLRTIAKSMYKLMQRELRDAGTIQARLNTSKVYAEAAQARKEVQRALGAPVEVQVRAVAAGGAPGAPGGASGAKGGTPATAKESLAKSMVGGALGMKRFIGGYLGWQAASYTVRQASDMELLAAQTKVLVGNDEKVADKMLTGQMLIDKALPLTIKEISYATSMLLQAGAGAGGSLKMAREMGDISGADVSRYKRTAYAMAEIMNKQKLEGSETRQLASAGWNPLVTMLKHSEAVSGGKFKGMTMDDLLAMRKKGKISAEDVKSALEVETTQGLHKGFAAGQMNTMSGKWSSFQTSLTMGIYDIYKRIKPTVMSVMDLLTNINYNKIANGIITIIDAIKAFTRGFTDAGGLEALIALRDAFVVMFVSIGEALGGEKGAKSGMQAFGETVGFVVKWLSRILATGAHVIGWFARLIGAIRRTGAWGDALGKVTILGLILWITKLIVRVAMLGGRFRWLATIVRWVSATFNSTLVKTLFGFVSRLPFMGSRIASFGASMVRVFAGIRAGALRMNLMLGATLIAAEKILEAYRAFKEMREAQASAAKAKEDGDAFDEQTMYWTNKMKDAKKRGDVNAYLAAKRGSEDLRARRMSAAAKAAGSGIAGGEGGELSTDQKIAEIVKELGIGTDAKHLSIDVKHDVNLKGDNLGAKTGLDQAEVLALMGKSLRATFNTQLRGVVMAGV